MDNNGRYAYSSVIPVNYTAIMKALHVYPNPARSYIVVEHGATNNHTQLQLINASGSIVKTITVAGGVTQTRLNVHDVAKGTCKVGYERWQPNRKHNSVNTVKE